jgi:hypothetical protein
MKQKTPQRKPIDSLPNYEKPFSRVAEIRRGDEFTPSERTQIASNIIEFIVAAQMETTRNHFGVMVVEHKPMTFEQMHWLGAVHDDVLGRINHA